MDINESVFAFKLYELEEQYGKLQCRVRVCEEGGRDKIHSELQKAEDEFEENTLLLKEKVKSCRSGAVAHGLCHAVRAAGAHLCAESSGQQKKRSG